MLQHFVVTAGFLQSLVEFFGTLSREWALECMKDLLLVNLRGNLQIIVQVCLSFILVFCLGKNC